jgi:hypothetical protein
MVAIGKKFQFAQCFENIEIFLWAVMIKLLIFQFFGTSFQLLYL